MKLITSKMKKLPSLGNSFELEYPYVLKQYFLSLESELNPYDY